jgi:hypothetical protein
MRRLVLLGLLAASSIAARADVTYVWKDVAPDLTSTYLSQIVLHPMDSRRLLLSGGFKFGDTGFFSGLISSVDGGSTWTPTGGVTPLWLQDFSAHVGLPGTLFGDVRGNISTYNGISPPGPPAPGRVYRSEDFGNSWTLVGTTWEDGMSFVPFGADPTEVNRVFAVVTRQFSCGIIFPGCRDIQHLGIAVSHDGGRTWELSPGMAEISAHLLQRIDVKAPVPADPKRMFAVTKEVVFVTRDGAASWSRFDTGAVRSVRAIRADPRRSNVLYAIRQPLGGGDGDVLRSDDEGVSWKSIFTYHNAASSLEWFPDLAIDPARPDDLWLFGLELGIHHSSDGGRSWSRIGIAADQPVATQYELVRQLVLNPADPGAVLVEYQGRLLRGTPSVPRDPVIVEFQYEADRYWNAATAGEAFSQDYRMEPGHVHRTGLRFGAWRSDDAPAGAVGSCRFWPRPETGLRTRVLVLKGFECDAVKRDPGWTLEAEDEFYALPPAGGSCPAGLVPVRRFHNLKADLNHRLVGDASTAAEMLSRGWYDEGVRMCARPLGDNE